MSDPNAIVSPDGTRAAFIRDHNLWVRDLEGGAETALLPPTAIRDYGYATNNAGWVKRDSPVLLWSPGSDMIATFQHDGRGVGEMHMATTNVGHPELASWKYPLPGDSLIFRISRVVIHLDGPRVVTSADAAGPAPFLDYGSRGRAGRRVAGRRMERRWRPARLRVEFT